MMTSRWLCIMQAIPGVVEFSAAVRSCMIEYDQRVISLSSLLSLLEDIDAHLPPVRTPHSLHTRKSAPFPACTMVSAEKCFVSELRLSSHADLYSQSG